MLNYLVGTDGNYSLGNSQGYHKLEPLLTHLERTHKKDVLIVSYDAPVNQPIRLRTCQLYTWKGSAYIAGPNLGTSHITLG